MADYNEVLGHKYRGQWVSEMNTRTLRNLPPEVLDELQLSEEQRTALCESPPEEDEQTELANEFDKLRGKKKFDFKRKI